MALIKKVNGKAPEWGRGCWMADNATLTGDVQLGEDCTVWFNAVIRGDVHEIRIGDKTNIQDAAIIHCTYQKAPTNIGSNVSIAHGAIVHGCTIHDNVLIGMGAIILDGAVIHSGSVVAAGAVVLAGTIVEENSIYAGIPAKRVKATDEKMTSEIIRIAGNYPMYAGWYEDQP
ncbi:gamma carbonic anhydrase family protein [Pleomorphovibrio marinus]|uniref:gamma carbonic anhydrase family protein n=1 Tax=Pleomorphovibrio marinus TaxID=2164132 RepID=UPI000E0B3278|nr:gamma carbonic anhydrase family protein [Pleomorphovibrio marinus]